MHQWKAEKLKLKLRYSYVKLDLETLNKLLIYALKQLIWGKYLKQWGSSLIENTRNAKMLILLKGMIGKS